MKKVPEGNRFWLLLLAEAFLSELMLAFAKKTEILP